MGVYGEATLPCLEERNIPGKTWSPTCSVDSHCPEGKKCCWTKNGDVCTMTC